MPYIIDCQFWLIYPALFLFVGFITMELPKIVRESSIEQRNEKIESEMLSMGWIRCVRGIYWNTYKKDGFYLDAFWDSPEKVISEAKKVDEGVKAGARVLSQYMNIIEGKK